MRRPGSYGLKNPPEELFKRDTHPELPLDPDVVQPGVYEWPLHLTPSLMSVVFLGGCVGTASRYGITLVIAPLKDGWPLATFLVNMAGAFLLGLLLEALVRRGKDEGKRRLARLGVGTGFIGAFTTYSALAVETDLLLRNGHFGVACMYAGGSMFGGIIFSTIGIQVAAVHHKSQGKEKV